MLLATLVVLVLSLAWFVVAMARSRCWAATPRSPRGRVNGVALPAALAVAGVLIPLVLAVVEPGNPDQKDWVAGFSARPYVALVCGVWVVIGITLAVTRVIALRRARGAASLSRGAAR